MAELPILPVKTDALLADTTHMSPEEFGCYCRLLFVMWRHGGKINDDESELAAICGLPVARWRKIKEKIMRPMTVIGGLVSQKRLTDTWLQVQEVRAKRALAAEKRWKPKAKQMDMQMHSRSNANQNQIRDNTSLEDRPSEVVEVHLHDGSLATALSDSALREPSTAVSYVPKSQEFAKLIKPKRW